jgi:hypothetical protein
MQALGGIVFADEGSSLTVNELTYPSTYSRKVPFNEVGPFRVDVVLWGSTDSSPQSDR